MITSSPPEKAICTPSTSRVSPGIVFTVGSSPSHGGRVSKTIGSPSRQGYSLPLKENKRVGVATPRIVRGCWDKLINIRILFGSEKQGLPLRQGAFRGVTSPPRQTGGSLHQIGDHPRQPLQLVTVELDVMGDVAHEVKEKRLLRNGICVDHSFLKFLPEF